MKQDVIQRFVNVTGFKVCSCRFKYLDVSIIFKRILVKDCMNLVEKITCIFFKSATLNSKGLQLLQNCSPSYMKGCGECKNRSPFSEGLRLTENRSSISNKGPQFLD